MYRVTLSFASLAPILFVTTAWAKDGTDVEKARIAAQKICPVSGKALGSMGAPLKVRAGEQDVYLCCRGCVGKQIPQQNWNQVLTNLAAAQKECPVMKHKLPANPKMTVVNRRIVFVCCEPCIRRIKADPKPHLDFVDQHYTTNHKH